VLDLGSSGQAGCGNYASENKAANGSYSLVQDYFTVVNGEHHIQFDRSVCIDPSSTDNDAENWAIVSDATTAAALDSAAAVVASILSTSVTILISTQEPRHD
jgi:hypothetical protein